MGFEINYLKTTLPPFYSQDERRTWRDEDRIEQAEKVAYEYFIPNSRHRAEISVAAAQWWQIEAEDEAARFGNYDARLLKHVSKNTAHLKEVIQNRGSWKQLFKDIENYAVFPTAIGTVTLIVGSVLALFAAEASSDYPIRARFDERLRFALCIIWGIGAIIGYVYYKLGKSAEKSQNDAIANTLLSHTDFLKSVRPDEKFVLVESITNPSQPPRWMLKTQEERNQRAALRDVERLYNLIKQSSSEVLD